MQQEKIKKLEKDIFYYRHVNKELKTKLREIVASSLKQKSKGNKEQSHVAAAVE